MPGRDRWAAWRAINSTYGVSTLVNFGEHVPARMPHDLVTGLMARCDHTGRLLPPQVLKAGDNVHLLSGPFRAIRGGGGEPRAAATGVGAARPFGQPERISVEVAQLRSA